VTWWELFSTHEQLTWCVLSDIIHINFITFIIMVDKIRSPSEIYMMLWILTNNVNNIEHWSTVWVKKIPPLRLSEFFSFFQKRLRIFNLFFTHLLYVPTYSRLQIFIQLSSTLTKLCHMKRDYLVHIMCAKCPLSAKTCAFRHLRKLLIALLIVVCGRSLWNKHFYNVNKHVDVTWRQQWRHLLSKQT